MNEENSPKSAAPKLLIGCGIGCLVLILLAVGGGFAAYYWAVAWYEEKLEEFEGQGFKRREGLVQDITEDITEKTAFGGQVVKIRANCNTDLVIVAQVAEIYGEIEGTLYFRGQVLTVKSAAKIHGDLDVFAQQIILDGELGGEVKGDYQMLINRDGSVQQRTGLEPVGEPTEDGAPTDEAQPLPDSSEEKK